MNLPNSIIFAILFAFAFLESYELIYHFTFPIYWNYFRYPFISGSDIEFILTAGIALLPLVIVRDQLSLKVSSFIFLSIFVVMWCVWVLYGFPQYFSSLYFYPTIFKTNDPWDTSLLYNFGSKVVLSLFFLTLPRFFSINNFVRLHFLQKSFMFS